MNCNVPVPPNFAKAIIDNVCPACGKDILGPSEFRELIKTKSLLQDLAIDDNMKISVSAVISQRYDLVPKGTARRPDGLPSEEEIDATEGLSDEEKTRLKALREAQAAIKNKQDGAIVKEWGMDHGQFGSEGGGSEVAIDMALLDDLPLAGMDIAPLAATNSKEKYRTDLMAKAHALKEDPNMFRVQRAE